MARWQAAASGGNAKLQMPTGRFRSNAPPATYAYPPIGQKEAKEERDVQKKLEKLRAIKLLRTGKRGAHSSRAALYVRDA